MSNTRWFHARGQQQSGPVSFEELKQLAASGHLVPQDMLWAEGSPAWVPAGTQAGLFENAAGALPPTTAIQASAIGYFEPAAGLPPRAATTLRGHARPAGDVGEWPLDDACMAQFKEAIRLRKKVTNAAGLYRLLLLLMILGTVSALFAILFAAGSGLPWPAAIGIGFSFALLSGLCLLYYFAWRGTMRSQRWAPLTMFILFLIAIVFYVSTLFLRSSGNSADATAGVIGVIILDGLWGLFAFISWRSFAAIPKYLAQPGWCQELIVTAGL